MVTVLGEDRTGRHEFGGDGWRHLFVRDGGRVDAADARAVVREEARFVQDDAAGATRNTIGAGQGNERTG